MPPLIVTGRTGALGKTNRSGAASSSMGTMGSKSVASAPRPCIQMTLPVAAPSDGSISRHSRYSLMAFSRGRTAAV